MKTYGVHLPISGIVYVRVEAENEEQAIQKALSAKTTLDDIQEFDVHEKLIDGDICNTYHTKADVWEEK